MSVIRFVLGQLQANCYFLIQHDECIIIDPADEASFILEELQRRRLKPIALFATHGHFDHIMAAGEMQKSFDVPMYVFKEDLFLVKRLHQTAEHFLGYRPAVIGPAKIKYLHEGEVKIGSFTLKIIITPGHTPGSACFYFGNEKALFTGDTLFKNGVGSHDHSYSSKIQLMKSIKKILEIPDGVIIYPGHGETTTLNEEKLLLYRFIDKSIQ